MGTSFQRKDFRDRFGGQALVFIEQKYPSQPITTMSWVINAYVWFSSCKTHTEHCSNTKIDFHFSHYSSWRTEDKNCALNYTVNLLHIVIFIDWFLHAGKKDLVSQNYLRFNSRHEWFCLCNLFTNTKNRPTHTKALGETSNHHRSPYLVGNSSKTIT